MTTPPAPPPPVDPSAPPPVQPPAPAPDQPGPVPYDRFKQVNDEKARLESELKKRDDQQKAAADKALADQNEWKTLAEKREQELKDERTERLRLQVATAKGLPVELAARLQGGTQAEMEADADQLLKLVKPPDSRGVPPPGGNGSRPGSVDFSKMTPAQIREYSKKKK